MKINKSIIAFLLLIISLLSVGCTKEQDKPMPKVEKGVIDFENWDFDKDGVVKIDGRWEFYWEQLLEPKDFDTYKPKLTGYYDVPLVWTKYKNLNLKSKGYATYRVKFKNSNSSILAIKTNEIASAYKIWINGRLATERGQFFTDKIPYKNKDIYLINELEKVNEIVLQVYNDIDKQAGTVHSWEIGEFKALNKKHLGLNIIDAMLIGVCLIMGFYHLILYYFRKKGLEALIFGLFCLTVGIRTSITGEIILLYIIPNINYIYGVKLSLLTIPIASGLFVYFTYCLYKKDTSLKMVYFFEIINAFFFLIVLLLPVNIARYILNYFLIVVFFQTVFVLCVLVMVVYRKRQESIYMLLGFLFLFVSITNDILYVNQIIKTFYSLAIGLMAFLFFQTSLLARRFSKAFGQVEELSKKLVSLDKLKDEFLANTSHELRTPVNGIIGITESLIDGVAGIPTEKMKENLQMVVSSGKRLGSLINDLLDFLKLKNKDIQLQSKNIDLKQLSDVVLTVLKSTISDENIILINEVKEFTYVNGDENRLQQILYNIVGNALKFTEEGFVKITSKQNEKLVEICVEDSGIGIPKEKHEDIFKSFEQSDGSTEREFGGTGLGLSISKQLVELHNGRIWVESEKGKGSKFYFTLTKGEVEITKENSVTQKEEKITEIKLVENDLVEPQILLDDEQKKINSNIKILVVDDEKINVQVLTNQLSLAHYYVDTAVNGIEALEKVNTNNYDLILLDVMMPRMSGYEVCKTVREKQSIYDLPIIMLTAKNQTQDIIVGFDVGANDYLTKPFEKNELIARVKTLLKLKSSVKEAIDNARLANTDGLTGLVNRRHLFELAYREFESAKRYDRKLSVMMMDIDNFKKFNDKYGHDVGDEILKLVSKTVEQVVRNVDIAGITGRYGGEEFGVVLRETSIEGGIIAGERIRKAVEEVRVKTEKFKDLKCTVSIGVATFTRNEMDIEELFKKADEKLYVAKENGKNRVEF